MIFFIEEALTMYIIAGLGNPTDKYDKTRHNVGFDTIDLLAKDLGVTMGKSIFKALIGKTMIGSEKVLLVKPLTFMNLSGNAIRAIMHFYKINVSKLVVIYDDVDLDVGRLRIRKKGSAGGHNGMKSIIAQVGSEEFCRIRVGIGHRPEEIDMINYVLGRFSKEDRAQVEDAMDRAAKAAKAIVTDGCDIAMNKYNG